MNGGNIKKAGSNRYAELSSGSYSSPYLDLINVKYFIAILRDQSNHIPGNFINNEFKDSGYSIVFNDRGSVILENPNALDRAFLAKSYLVVSEEQTENLISFKSSFNPKEIVLLDKDPLISHPTGIGIVEITDYLPNFVNIKTQTEQKELLVLSDQFDEGWHAKIDNQKTDIIKANFLLRAIKIPAGNHNIVFYYWPASFDLGLKISILSLFILIIVMLISIKRRLF